jgi:hypothetical protein
VQQVLSSKIHNILELRFSLWFFLRAEREALRYRVFRKHLYVMSGHTVTGSCLVDSVHATKSNCIGTANFFDFSAEWKRIWFKL